MEETLEQAAEMIGYQSFRAEQAEARARGRLRGLGLSLFVEPTSIGGGAFGAEGAVVRVEPDGSVTVSMGTGSHGQSLETTIAQVVADELGVDMDRVTLRQGDGTPYGFGTGGSRSAVIAGGAARAAASVVGARIARIAAHLLEAAPEDVLVERGSAFVAGTPARQVSVAEVADVAYRRPESVPEGVPEGLEHTARYRAPEVTNSNAAHACICEVDPGTGLVQIIRYVVSEDCGNMVNPMVVEGQIAGGVVQGIGGALYEWAPYDGDGNPRATTLLGLCDAHRRGGAHPRAWPCGDPVEHSRWAQGGGGGWRHRRAGLCSERGERRPVSSRDQAHPPAAHPRCHRLSDRGGGARLGSGRGHRLVDDLDRLGDVVGAVGH